MEIGSLAGLIGGVQSGLGIAILPVLAARPAPSRTVLRDLADLDLSLPVGLVRREHGVPNTPVVSAFLSRLVESKGGLRG